MRRYVGVIAVIVTALVFTGAALGQTPGGYQGPGESVQGELGGPTGVAGEQAGALPFSGQDLTLLAAGGAALILVGGTFYRLSRRRQ